jgi:hypothetical protein
MRTVFSVSIKLREKLGCVGVVVEAKPGAKNYYSRHRFVELEVIQGVLEERPSPKPMFLPCAPRCRRSASPGRETPTSCNARRAFQGRFGGYRCSARRRGHGE